MKIGERALIHVPPAVGYGSQSQGQLDGNWYIPANSNIVYDVEVLREVIVTKAPTIDPSN